MKTIADDALTFNVQDYGAKGDGSDDGPAIQSCIDALAALQATNPGHGTVYFPQTKGSYIIQSPVFMDRDNQSLVGAPGMTNIFSAWGGLYLGIQRYKPSAAHTPDSFGVLDKTVSPAPGYKFGISTQGDTIAQFQSNRLQYGGWVPNGVTRDYWGSNQQLTIEFCVAFGETGKALPGAQICGLGTWQFSNPWVVFLDGNDPQVWYFSFTTEGDTAPRHFTFKAPTTQGPFRITIQIDLATAGFLAFVNDVCCPGTYGDNRASNPKAYTNPWKPGLHFQANDATPFTIGQIAVNQTIYGLKVSRKLRYASPGAGNTLNPKPTDVQRYFTSDADTVAYLALDNRQPGNQLVYVWEQGGVQSTGLIILPGVKWASNLALENLNIQGSAYSGAGVWIGPTFNVALRRLNVYGFTGVASWVSACTYNVTIEDCMFQGVDCNYYGYFQIIRATNIDFGQSGRDVLRLTSCDANFQNCFVSAPCTDTVIKSYAGGYGSALRFTNWIIDFEGYTVNKAIIYCENQPYVPGTTLALEDFFIGTVGDVPCVILKDMGTLGTWNKGWFSAENVMTWGPYSTFVQTDGPLWGGQVNAYFLNPKALNKHIPTWGPTSSIKFTNVPAK